VRFGDNNFFDIADTVRWTLTSAAGALVEQVILLDGPLIPETLFAVKLIAGLIKIVKSKENI
jgi:hypothetical protein